MKTVAISILGTVLDKRGKRGKRWDKWRPTVSMFQHDDLMIDRLDLVFDRNSQRLADQVTEDIYHASPETKVVHHYVNFEHPWDFETVYSELLDFCRSYTFKPSREQYLTHITTGTHVAQICLYLLTEAGYLPGKLLQTSPPRKNSAGENETHSGKNQSSAGEYQIIDLDLSKYDQIASRFQKEHKEGTSYLKGGIETNNPAFNTMIEQLEKVSVRSNEPILITGPTGAGKSQLAQRVYELRKHRGIIEGNLVAVNCATLRGENAMSALFGHKKGAFTGATTDRPGLLKEADQGLLFLDEIGELGIDEQAMLLRAIEDKRFIPFGADKETSSNFQLIAGTNKDLAKYAHEGKFREDLLARIDLWEYNLPSLKERPEDIEPNIEYEIEKFASKSGQLISFNKTARDIYLSFSQSPEAKWSANFRDLNASITRLGTLADGGRITAGLVKEEIDRLKTKWKVSKQSNDNPIEMTKDLIGEARFNHLDLYDQIILAGITKVCRNSNSMAEAGRTLFNQSRTTKKSTNDSHRVRQLLEKYGVSFDELNR
ncbi:RNA repair transcriptional activator RtcR [Marinibactrum halimedae]|uniref:Fis family transcriptional regulator n=1 Tax=Marinibactrum halimedae TaxID=1444977 RepID=A0AA37WLP0_9GAMM|nr:RNA repair transcriptional activator RtcR [Marinibactrum halimedae]MCD9457932.1 RNA repair transcriptional activator RtcR [Marinibactrum halimedae]GLS26239.1 Fis family transcriptional regulator [Marinibactrum halimedae]